MSSPVTEPTPRRLPLPEGTLPVGLGVVVSGITSYAFFKVGQVALGKEAFKPVMTLWFVAYTLVPGFFIPVEQELGRALADRRARGSGGLPVIRRVSALTLALLSFIVVAVVAASGWMTEHMFEGDVVVTVALVGAVASYALAHVAKGISSGSGRFPSYGIILGGDAAVRITACTALWMAGVTNVGLYAMTMVVSPLVAVGIVFIRGDLRADDGPPITLRQVTPNLGWLLVGSFMSAALVNAGPLGVDVLASSAEAAKVTAFGNGVILARIPLFMFQAIQAALLPRLARLVAERKFDEFRHSFNRLMTAVGGLAVTGAVATYFFGPKVLDIVYGGGLNGRTLGLLAVSSGLYMLAQSCAQAVIALHGHRQVAIGWLASAATFVAVTATVSDDLYLRVELGLVAGCAVAFVYFLVAMRSRIASGETVDVQSLVEGVLDSPLEG